jgi:hypothetical protein
MRQRSGGVLENELEVLLTIEINDAVSVEVNPEPWFSQTLRWAGV